MAVGLAVLLLVGQSAAQAPASSSGSAGKSITLKFTDHKLKNGLRVILSEDHSAPTYSIAVAYFVGSRDERPGRTGFAHLFEHMMFQGSENAGRGEHSFLIANNGGGLNGTTNNDRTLYFETLPANQLELGLFLEADRMKALVINQFNLDNQRNAVQEERRLRLDNQPYGKTFEAIDATAYDNFAYKHSVIGSMEDLNAATLDDVKDFFRVYYAPNNAVVVLVGDFNSKDALAKVDNYFGGIPSQPPPTKPDLTEPPQTAERRLALEDALARAPRLDIVYKIPPAGTPDWFALSVAGAVLSSGQSSRFYQKLVREKEVATFAGGGAGQRTGPSLFSIGVSMRPGKTFEEVEKLVYDEIDRLANEPVSDDELAKVRMSARRGQVSQMQSTLNRAARLADLISILDDPNLINTFTDKLQSVTKADVQRVARTYLKPTNRTVVTTSPKPQAPGARPGAQRPGAGL
jgi:predicted Zn-dependent peptidase